MWLGYEDSNLGMPESESGALPLGDTPMVCRLSRAGLSPVLYSLEISNSAVHLGIWLGYEDSNLGMPESESGALPLGDTPTNCF